MKKLTIIALCLLSTCSLAMGLGFETPDIVNAAPGFSLVIPIAESGSFATDGVTLYLEVAEPLQITAVGLDAGTIWADNTMPNDIVFGNTASASTTTVNGSVMVPGIVALVTLTVPADAPDGDYVFRTFIPGVGNSWLGGWGNFAWPPEDEPWNAQTIVHVPEPLSVFLLIAAVPCLRRRHR